MPTSIAPGAHIELRDAVYPSGPYWSDVEVVWMHFEERFGKQGGTRS